MVKLLVAEYELSSENGVINLYSKENLRYRAWPISKIEILSPRDINVRFSYLKDEDHDIIFQNELVVENETKTNDIFNIIQKAAKPDYTEQYENTPITKCLWLSRLEKCVVQADEPLRVRITAHNISLSRNEFNQMNVPLYV